MFNKYNSVFAIVLIQASTLICQPQTKAIGVSTGSAGVGVDGVTVDPNKGAVQGNITAAEISQANNTNTKIPSDTTQAIHSKPTPSAPSQIGAMTQQQSQSTNFLTPQAANAQITNAQAANLIHGMEYGIYRK